jgi:hypothetical protein
MRNFDYRVAIRIPDESRDAANQIVVGLTGNPVDLQTFSTQITNGNETQWLSLVWMREQYFLMLEDFREQLGGEYAIMAQKLDGVWVQFGDVYEWLAQAGFSVVEVEDGID